MNIKKSEVTLGSYQRSPILWIMILALLVRLVHLSSTAGNPMTYNPGADEVFYLNFGKDVASGQYGLSSDFIFMDPLYGYFIGLLTWIIGQNLFLIYFVQVIVDIFTIYFIYAIGKFFWDQRAGLIAATLYTFCGTAIFYTTTILKPTLVSFYIVLWIFLTIRLLQIKNIFAWLIYGVFLGLGVSLRSNLLLLVVSSFFLIPLMAIKNNFNNNLLKKIIAAILGFSMMCFILGARNTYISGHWSVFPPNSGIVLHQVFNNQNLESVHFVPDFVSYRTPAEILSGYKKEAEKRTGKGLTVYETNNYWRNQALDYIQSNPGIVLRNIFRKAKEFTAFKEIQNNRFFNEESFFSPVLRHLPLPFGFLFAMGLPGIILLTLRNRVISLPVVFAVASVFFTFIVFFATARFRIHGLPLFAIGSGIFITYIFDWKNREIYKTLAVLIFSIMLGILTIWNGYQIIQKQTNLMDFAWGYIKMNQPEQAKHYALLQIEANPENAGPYELLGYTALNSKQYEKAISLYSKAAILAPQHHIAQYNLALSLSKTGQFKKALTAINLAINIASLPEYLSLRDQILKQINN